MEAIIKEVYESNFGTAYETYKEAVKKDNSIRLQDVKDYSRPRMRGYSPWAAADTYMIVYR